MLKGLYHRVYLCCLRVGVWYLRVFLSRDRKRLAYPAKSILALPSYPENWPGGKERMANWKPYFEADGIDYEVEWPCTDVQYLAIVDRPGTFRAFCFHLKVLIARMKVLRRIFEFDVVYIQREVIPFYDSRYPGFEKAMVEMHKGVVFDFYDADYASTPIVTNAIFRRARKIVVASPYLFDHVSQFCSAVLFSRLSLPVPQPKPPRTDGALRLGWMGSPGNAKNLLGVDLVLKDLSAMFPELVFSFVCRHPPELDFRGIEGLDMNDPDFDYGGWLHSLDLGIVPYLVPTERTKAKTAMKSLEFWANRIPMVCSPFGMSDRLHHGVNALVAKNVSEWKAAVSTLVEDAALRAKLAQAGYATFLEYHTYESNYKELRDFLFLDVGSDQVSAPA